MTCNCKCCCGCCCNGSTGSQTLEPSCEAPKVFHGKGTICDVCCDLGEIREDITSEGDCPGTWVTNGRCLDNPCGPCSGPCPCPSGCECCDGQCVTQGSTCPAYPIQCYVTGGACNTAGYRSLEVQCVDANGVRVYDWRAQNGGSGAGSWTFLGCGATPSVAFCSSSEGAKSVCGCDSAYCRAIAPSDFVCCAPFGGGTSGGSSWCDNPQGTCFP